MCNTNKKLWLLLAACGAGTLFQVTPGSCSDYFLVHGLTALDFCAIFNCTGGAFFDLCNPIPLFVDCF